jgi:uncharacterized protein (TIGR03067 family)
MKWMQLNCAVTMLVLATACSTQPAHMNDTNLQGKWICVSAVVNGKPLGEETIKSLSLTISENRYKTEKGSEVLFDSTYTIDSSETPNKIRMIGTEGELTGKEAHGIYLLEKDTLKICYTMPGDLPPLSFQSTAGSKAYLVVWRRR